MSMRNLIRAGACWLILTSAVFPQAASRPPVKSSGLTDSAGDPLPAGAVARLGVTRFRHGGANAGMAIHPDSATLVTTAESGGDVRFWEIATGKLLHRIRDDKQRFPAVAYSPDGKWFVTTAVSADFRKKDPPELICWDARTKQRLRTAPLGKEGPTRLLFTPDSKFLLGDVQGNVIVIEAETGKELLRYRLAQGALAALALSPDGRLVAASAENRTEVKLWEWESVLEPRVLPSDRDRGFGTLAFSPDGKLLFGRGRDTGDDGIAIWNVETGKLVKNWIGHRSLDYADHFALHPEGKLVAVLQSGNRDGDDGPGIFLWNVDSGKLERRLPSGGRIMFSKDGRWLAARAGGGVRVWDVRTGQEVAVVEAAHRGDISRMEQSAQGILATASTDHTIGLWDAGGKFLRKLPLGESAYDLSFSADSALLLAARADWIDLWEVASGKKRFSIPGHGRYGGRRAVAFAAEGAQFCSFGDDYFFRRYRTRNGKALIEKRIIPTGMDAKKILAGRDDTSMDFFLFRLVGAEFTSDGQALVVAQHNRIHVFDTSTGEELRYFDTEDVLDYNGFALSPDGRRLLASGREASKAKERTESEPKQFAVIWDLTSGKVVRRTPLSERYVPRVAFSPDGKHYAAVCTDYPRGQRIRIWECATGKEVRVMDNLPETVRSVLFSPDGRRLYTSLDDTTVVIWNLP